MKPIPAKVTKKSMVAAVAVIPTMTFVSFVSAQRQERPVFRAGVELVEVDVVVVDKAGTPVHGLTRDDFVVLDRRRPQTIETFQEVRRERDAGTMPALLPATRADVASNTTARADRLVVLVLDDLHTYRGRTETVKQIARTIVADLGPASSMALIQTGGEHSTEVTDDRSQLMASIDRFQGRRAVRRPTFPCNLTSPKRDPEAAVGSAPPGCDVQDFNADMMLYRSLQDAARLLGGTDRRRKAFVLVSENVAKDLSGLFGASLAPDRDPRDSSAYAAGGGVEALAAIPVAAYNYHDVGLLEMMDAMRRGNVATYAIDPRGHVSTQELMQECHPGAFGADPCLGGAGGPPDWTAWVRQAQHGLEIIGEASGGFAVVNTDDFTSGVARILSDLDNYYLLSFNTPDTTTKGYRRLEVQVRGRPDLTLRYRRGYQIDGKPAEAAGDPLAALIRGALPKRDLAMRLHAIPMPYSSKEARVAIALEITIPRRAIEGADPQLLLDQIRYGVFAIDLKGAKVREQFGYGARIGLRPTVPVPQLPDHVTYEIMSMMQLPFGRYQIRAAATSEKLDGGGSVYLSLDVPDFSRQDPGLTDLLLAYADGPHVPIARSRPRSVVPAANVLPFDPTLDRVFSARHTLRLFFRVVQRAPTPMIATISALRADGGVALTLTRQLPAREDASLDINLPLQQLQPGNYRLQVTVADGARTRSREVGFTIK